MRSEGTGFPHLRPTNLDVVQPSHDELGISNPHLTDEKRAVLQQAAHILKDLGIDDGVISVALGSNYTPPHAPPIQASLAHQQLKQPSLVSQAEYILDTPAQQGMEWSHTAQDIQTASGHAPTWTRMGAQDLVAHTSRLPHVSNYPEKVDVSPLWDLQHAPSAFDQCDTTTQPIGAATGLPDEPAGSRLHDFPPSSEAPAGDLGKHNRFAHTHHDLCASLAAKYKDGEFSTGNSSSSEIDSTPQSRASWSPGEPLTSPQSLSSSADEIVLAEELSDDVQAGERALILYPPDVQSVLRLADKCRNLPVAKADRPSRTRRRLPKDGVSQRKPRGAFRDDRQRAETGLTRKVKACIRCRLQRIRCDVDLSHPSGMCMTCQKLSEFTQARLPCLRYKISDTQLLDKGLHPRFSWTNRWKRMAIVEIDEWQSDDIRTITLTQDVGNACYDLRVRQFVTKPGDCLHRMWKTNGQAQQYLCAAYAIANMAETAGTFTKFVDDHMKTYVEHYIDESDVLLRNTYSMAYRHMLSVENKAEKSLLHSVLRLWTACRMENKQERLCGVDCLGMEPQLFDPSAGNYDKICVPPVMQAQIEILTTVMVLLPMKQAVLKRLEKLVASNSPEVWFTIYLVMFILLHSCGLLTKADRDRCLREAPVGSKDRYYNRPLVEEFHMGANIMLAHFHYCNKGGHPFSMDWSQPGHSTFARLDKEQVQFLQETVKLLANKRDHFREIREQHQYEDGYFFVSQLYDESWQPLSTFLG